MTRSVVLGIVPLVSLVAAGWLASACAAHEPPSIPPPPLMPSAPEEMTDVPSEPGPSAAPTPEPVAPDAPPPAAAPAGSLDDGKACTIDAECKSGICEGEGCDTPAGKCASKDRMCTQDIQEYCGCDGKPFSSSGSCPGRRFKNRGACKT